MIFLQVEQARARASQSIFSIKECVLFDKATVTPVVEVSSRLSLTEQQRRRSWLLPRVDMEMLLSERAAIVHAVPHDSSFTRLASIKKNSLNTLKYPSVQPCALSTTSLSFFFFFTCYSSSFYIIAAAASIPPYKLQQSIILRSTCRV